MANHLLAVLLAFGLTACAAPRPRVWRIPAHVLIQADAGTVARACDPGCVTEDDGSPCRSGHPACTIWKNPPEVWLSPWGSKLHEDCHLAGLPREECANIR
jgi:hypothetical protein